MKLCNDTITVFNKRVENHEHVFYPTVIDGVSWWGHVSTNVGDKGLNAANSITVRIPVDADFSGKAYVDPREYADAASPDGIFTLANGDVIIKGSVVLAPLRPAELKAQFANFMTVLGVTDNRRAPNAPHFRVVGS